MKKLKLLIAVFCMIISFFDLKAQSVGINNAGSAPDQSALLDLSSSNKGFLITRADTLNINSPAFGLMTLSPSDSCLYLYNGIIWIGMGGAGNDCVCGVPINGSASDCGTPFIDARDNISYGTVEIGSQCWISENLNHIPSSGNSWCYDNDNNNCDIYGRLYNWDTAMNNVSGSSTNPSGIQGVCPAGWHLPSDNEWKELEMAVGMPQAIADNIGFRGTTEGDALKATNFGGNNSSGFTALPGGLRFASGTFVDKDKFGYWWTTSENGSVRSRRALKFNESGIYRGDNDRGLGQSVRCIRD